MSPTLLIFIAFGGAVGAVGRYIVTSAAGHWLGHGFPFGTIIVNVVGSFILGALLEVMALAWSPGENLRAFFVIGMMGAFTTFSTFSLDTITLIERGELVSAAGYIGGSVLLSVAAFFCGMVFFRHFLP